MNRAITRIQNLKCSGCESRIIAELEKIVGVSDIKIDHSDESIHLTYDNIASLSAARVRMSELGYPPIDAPNSIGSKVQSYVSCMIGKIKK